MKLFKLVVPIVVSLIFAGCSDDSDDNDTNSTSDASLTFSQLVTGKTIYEPKCLTQYEKTVFNTNGTLAITQHLYTDDSLQSTDNTTTTYSVSGNTMSGKYGDNDFKGAYQSHTTTEIKLEFDNSEEASTWYRTLEAVKAAEKYTDTCEN
ncbi:MAG: hypothetical protein DRQ51_07485 [Gammaproteobacteria bacterium]|nr:MAG: hypothetical protein DRQ51_07485 [Gammaproteobacteria bacterium]